MWISLGDFAASAFFSGDSSVVDDCLDEESVRCLFLGFVPGGGCAFNSAGEFSRRSFVFLFVCETVGSLASPLGCLSSLLAVAPATADSFSSRWFFRWRWRICASLLLSGVRAADVLSTESRRAGGIQALDHAAHPSFGALRLGGR
ncbi:hypothetical protein SEVIR_4G132800v4 [Setaria viridis]|uniref:Uncharacterized protein n=2 Tax=Setaria TaxID=4554 RepID=K3Y4C0_SETIT|nr:hypothetical protein SETIT_4G164700v2 [Setaria italica]TKW21641.1 hypothetical protein SEVIR_4G132800v2 [Setaria viridis]